MTRKTPSRTRLQTGNRGWASGGKDSEDDMEDDIIVYVGEGWEKGGGGEVQCLVWLIVV